jgi:hypothetical protein
VFEHRHMHARLDKPLGRDRLSRIRTDNHALESASLADMGDDGPGEWKGVERFNQLALL